MKKLLIVMLVLGMASTANALIVQLGVGGATNGAGVDMTTTLSAIEVVSDTSAEPYVRYLFAPDITLLDITGVVARSTAGTESVVNDLTNALGDGTHLWEIQAVDMSPPLTSIVAGIQFDATAALQPGKPMGVMQLLSEDLTVVLDSVTVVPEPASMLLIGLGGLFLRRRR